MIRTSSIYTLSFNKCVVIFMQIEEIWTDRPSYIDIHKGYDSRGGSPSILKNFTDYLNSKADNIKSIDLCLYLYNNLYLHETLIALSKKGIKVRVFSIPLEGYDNSRQKIYDYENNRILYNNVSQSKLSLAEEIYCRASDKEARLLELRVCPHMYIRSNQVKPFSRGNMPYSLHCKSILIEMKSGECIIGLTSSNLAVRDLPKFEIMVLGQGNKNDNENAIDFFQGLTENSILISDFDSNANYFNFNIQLRPQPHKSWNMYIAPFYSDSPDNFENHLVSIIKRANKRIIICAQHISSFYYSYNTSFKTYRAETRYTKKPGFLSTVIDKAKSGVEVLCISQTFVDKNGDSHGCRKPQNIQSFKDFIKVFSETPNCHYSINSNTHSKFIIADDIVVITTCNFTPTQFIYLPYVNIDKFTKIPDQKYQGIHSEIGQYIVFKKDTNFCDIMENHFAEIWNDPDTIHPF